MAQAKAHSPSPYLASSSAGAGGDMATTTPQRRRDASGGSNNNNNVVSYESFAPRSSAQVARLSKLATLTIAPTARAGAASATTTTKSGGGANPKKKEGGGEEDEESLLFSRAMAVPAATSLSSSSAEDEEEGAVEEVQRQAVQRAQLLARNLQRQLKHTTSLRMACRASMNIAEDISASHAALIRHSSELSAAADRLQEEAEVMAKHAAEIGHPLQHYDSVDRIGIIVGVLFKGNATVRGLAKIKVDNDDYPAILDEIDQAVEYFGRESGGKEALQALQRQSRGQKQQQQLMSGNLEYYRRALALQEAALYLVKEAVAERISTTAQQITGATQKTAVQADQLEASLIYTRFHGISSRSNRLLALIKSRLHRGEAYHELLQTCRSTYCASREALLRHTVRTHMDKLNQQHGAVGMTRLASVFLIRLCTIETALYTDFFGNKDDPDDRTYTDTDFQAYLASLCTALHRTIRRSLVTMLDLDTLCQIVSVLREEGQQAARQSTTIAAARAMAHVMEDAQERVIFCANTTLTRQVIRFKATPADLDYPGKLQKMTSAGGGSDSGSDAITTSKTTAAQGEEEDAAERQLNQVYESWFPPVRTVLRILSKIFRVVDARVFEDMALQSVQACVKSLKDGARFILQRKGVMHADLFQVKHLLILREQLSPFDIELRSVERQLDFSDAGKAVRAFLANRNRRIFSMSTENALVTLLREGVSVQESSVDSKRDLEEALKSACNDFIEHTAKAIAGDLLAFLEQYKSSDSNSLAKKALVHADAVVSMLAKTLTTLESAAEDVTTQMTLYLENPATQSILLKPVSRRVTRATDSVRKCVAQCADGDNDWDTGKRDDVIQLTNKINECIKKATKPTRG